MYKKLDSNFGGKIYLGVESDDGSSDEDTVVDGGGEGTYIYIEGTWLLE